MMYQPPSTARSDYSPYMTPKQSASTGLSGRRRLRRPGLRGPRSRYGTPVVPPRGWPSPAAAPGAGRPASPAGRASGAARRLLGPGRRPGQAQRPAEEVPSDGKTGPARRVAVKRVEPPAKADRGAAGRKPRPSGRGWPGIWANGALLAALCTDGWCSAARRRGTRRRRTGPEVPVRDVPVHAAGELRSQPSRRHPVWGCSRGPGRQSGLGGYPASRCAWSSSPLNSRGRHRSRRALSALCPRTTGACPY